MDKTKSVPDMLESLELILIDIKRQIDITKPRFILVGNDVSYIAININDNGNIQKIGVYPYSDEIEKTDSLRIVFYFKNGITESAYIKKEYFKAMEYLKTIGYIVEDMRTISTSKPEWVNSPIIQQK
jgi:hypothetical protein